MLAVKQLVPPVRAGAVPRARLIERLEAARTRLTVVIAPAGWGKTSVLSAWAREPGNDQRVAWVSLDESDDEPGRFWRYLLTALTDVSHDLTTDSVDTLSAPDPPILELALPILLNELAASSTRHVLVLDDYHVLSDPQIHEAVEYLVSYLPESLRLVIAGRTDPPLPLARLRGRGELTEIRAADLKFSPGEASALIANVSGVELDVSDDQVVWRRTEGWAAGLQLAALALRADPTRLDVDEHHLLDYFATEVLPGLAPRQRDLLVHCAPLELLTGSLCDAALDVTGSATVLDELVRADLFVAPLDGEQQWYRCHRLLRDALRSQPDADPVGVLERAATWFADQDRIDDAVNHLLAAERHDAAAVLLLEHAESWFLARGAAATYVQLADRLPIKTVDLSLAYSIAYAAVLSGDRARVVKWLDVCQDLKGADAIAPGWHSFEAALLVLRSNFALTDSETDAAVAMARHAFQLEASGESRGHPVARWGLGACLARDGQFEESAAVLDELWANGGRDQWPSWLVLSVAGTLVVSLLEADRLEDCDRVLREVDALATAVEEQAGHAITPGVSALRLAAGRRSYQRADMADAVVRLEHAVELVGLHPRPTLLMLSLIYLADAQLGVGERVAAQACLTRAHDIATDEPVSPFVLTRLEAAEARIGKGAARAVRRSGAMFDELTDRELSILRALQGTASQREIGAALFLSVNTVKAYTKSLYRKLDVSSRQDAVAAARQLGLI